MHSAIAVLPVPTSPWKITSGYCSATRSQIASLPPWCFLFQLAELADVAAKAEADRGHGHSALESQQCLLALGQALVRKGRFAVEDRRPRSRRPILSLHAVSLARVVAAAGRLQTCVAGIGVRWRPADLQLALMRLRRRAGIVIGVAENDPQIGPDTLGHSTPPGRLLVRSPASVLTL